MKTYENNYPKYEIMCSTTSLENMYFNYKTTETAQTNNLVFEDATPDIGGEVIFLDGSTQAIRNIEIFFSDPNWDDSLDLYYANNLGQRMIADSVLIDGAADHDVGIKYKGNVSYNSNNLKNRV